MCCFSSKFIDEKPRFKFVRSPCFLMFFVLKLEPWAPLLVYFVLPSKSLKLVLKSSKENHVRCRSTVAPAHLLWQTWGYCSTETKFSFFLKFLFHKIVLIFWNPLAVSDCDSEVVWIQNDVVCPRTLVLGFDYINHAL